MSKKDLSLIYCVLHQCGVWTIWINTKDAWSREDLDDFNEEETYGLIPSELLWDNGFAEIDEGYMRKPCDPDMNREQIIEKIDSLGCCIYDKSFEEGMYEECYAPGFYDPKSL